MSAPLLKARAADGCELAYRIEGTAGQPRVVLIHSLALDHSFWQRVVPLLGEHAQMMVVDCRGHGASGRALGAGSDAAYRVDQFGADIATVLDHAGWPSATIAGCSMGGCIAQAFAAAHPQRVDGLVLVDTTAWYGADAEAQWRERGDTARAKGMAALVPFQVKRWFSESFTEANRPLVDALLAVFQANDVEAYRATCIMMGQANLSGRLSGLGKPCAILVGEEDYATPVSMSEALHAAIPGSTLQVIKGGRHLTPVQCPGEIAGAIRLVIGRAGAGR